jgi:hypothetical protein
MPLYVECLRIWPVGTVVETVNLLSEPDREPDTQG